MPRRAKRPHLFVEIPSIPWGELRVTHPPAFPLNEQVAALLLATIRQRSVIAHPEVYTNLKGAYLKRIHRDYNHYMSWLVESGIIARDNRYIPGSKSYGYRIEDPWRTNRTHRYRITNIRTIKAAERQKVEARKELKRVRDRRVQKSIDQLEFPFSSLRLLYPPPTNSCSFLRRMLNVLYSYDAPSVEREMEAWSPDYFVAIEHLRSSLDLTRIDPDWRKFVANQADQECWSVQKRYQRVSRMSKVEAGLANGEAHFSRDGSTGRLHTPITNLPAGLRAFLRLDGVGGLTHLDVTTCQPYLLLKLARDLELEPAAIREWEEAIVDPGSDIYAWLGGELGITREEAKHGFIKMLFQRNPIPNPIKDLFRARFPAFAQMLMVSKFGDHRELALTLQAYEAHAMLELVATRCAKQNIPLLTIHDSVIVRPPDTLAAMAIIERELTSFVGTRPRLRVTTL